MQADPQTLVAGAPAPAPMGAGTYLSTVVPGWNDVEPPGDIDRMLHATIGKFTHGISPASLALAYTDWALHLMQSPGKWERLYEKAVRKEAGLLGYAMRLCSGDKCPPCIEPLPQDRRFRDPAWQRWPFNLMYQAFLLNQQWWHNATTGVGGVEPHHEHVVAFMTRQLLDIVSPVNFIATNPEILADTAREGGMNLVRGALNFFEDLGVELRNERSRGAQLFAPGRQVAVTPGKVIFRNRLVEVIQYAPQTDTVHTEPVLIVPAWIMKYYILDLSPHNSLVNYLVRRGHTVFMMSWHNPDERDRDMGMDDYLRHGVFDAIRAVQTVVPQRKINAVGYCLGGTLLAIADAYLEQTGNAPFNTVTLLAAQTDFKEAGELTLFIDDSQLNFLDGVMWQQGYLDTRQMAGAFQLLRSNDLVWSRMVHDYLLGKRAPINDLMAWNADTTRMPYRMHSEYLRRLFLNNDLFEGRYSVEGLPITLSDIQVPIFAVATETDHVAPWRSVYKLNLVAETELTFLLTNGGHNAGIVSEPGHKNRHFKKARWLGHERYVDPDQWYLSTPTIEGSWWPVWAGWLRRNSSAIMVAPPAMGCAERGYPALADAPGTYVFET